MNTTKYWFQRGARCQEIGKAPRLCRHGKVISDFWGGYVDVEWDDGTAESGVHVRDIKPEVTR